MSGLPALPNRGPKTVQSRSIHFAKGSLSSEKRPHLDTATRKGSPPYKPLSKREPPLFVPAFLHKCVEEREMGQCAQVSWVQGAKKMAGKSIPAARGEGS